MCYSGVTSGIAHGVPLSDCILGLRVFASFNLYHPRRPRALAVRGIGWAAGLPVERWLAYARLVSGSIDVMPEKYLTSEGEKGIPDIGWAMELHTEQYTRMEQHAAARKAALDAMDTVNRELRADARRVTTKAQPYPRADGGGGAQPRWRQGAIRATTLRAAREQPRPTSQLPRAQPARREQPQEEMRWRGAWFTSD